MGNILRATAKTIYHAAPVRHLIETATSLAGTHRRFTERYMATHPVKRLQIGAGVNLRPGWLNTNWHPIRLSGNHGVFLDASKRFPFESNAFDYVYSEHMIEHIPYEGGLSMIRECFRVLKPGGKLRISTPDFAFLMDLMRPDKTAVQQAYIEWTTRAHMPQDRPAIDISVVNNYVRDWGHVYIYDKPSFAAMLGGAGFVEVTPFEVNESDEDDLRGIEHEERLPPDFLKLESMIFQAKKPA